VSCGERDDCFDERASQSLDLKVAGMEHSFDLNASRLLRLLPGRHRVEAPEKSFGVAFDVTVEGKVGYDPGMNGLLSGSGTRGLVVRGYEISLDETQLSYVTLALQVVGVDAEPSSATLRSLRLLPGGHRVEAPTWSFGAGFDVTMDGKVDFDPGLAYLSGRGTSTLVLHGVAVTVDPTRIDGWWSLRGVVNADTSKPVTVRVMPGQYRFLAPDAGLDFVFTVTPVGMVDYDPSLTYLSGRGTPTLIVGQSGSAAFSRQSDRRNRQPSNLIILVLLTVVVLTVWRARRYQQFWWRHGAVAGRRCPQRAAALGGYADRHGENDAGRTRRNDERRTAARMGRAPLWRLHRG
jgi:hypothetical protein